MDVGNYTLLHLLGRGGTSEVYAAKHRFLGDTVAVKVLRAALAADETHRDAFVAEAARTREIQHPNVVRVIDFGYDAASGSCYLVMEHVDGETLAQRLGRIGRLDEPALRELGAAIADGMAAAHARGIVHRDLKPGNVMLRGDVPVIVDFGIAKSLGSTTAAVTERRIGTVAYMAPEQLVDGLITPAVDIWALGVTLYEAATGDRPFSNFQDGRLPQLFEAPPRASISPGLDRLIARCLERDPGKRPVSMAEVATALRGDDGDRMTADIGPTVAAQRRSKLPSKLPFVLAGAVAVAAIATALVFMRPAKKQPPAVTAPAQVVTPPPPPVVVEQPAAVEQPAVVEQPPPPPPREPKRTKPRPKPRATRQGETLD